MNRKAFSPTTVVLYLLALFMGSLILFYGYESISGIINQGEKAIYIKFQAKLESQLNEVAGLPGTIRILDLTIPSSFNKICFFDYSDICKLPDDLKEYETVVCDSVNDEFSNIFLFPLAENDLNIPKIEIDENGGPLCIDAPSNSFKLKITGQGKTVLLSEP